MSADLGKQEQRGCDLRFKLCEVRGRSRHAPRCFLFSANPVTGNRDEVMINASWGLGESIVGGTVTPDTFVVRKSDLASTSRTIADKQRMTVSVPDGTREVDVPRFLRLETCLAEEQLIEMAQLALSLEATMGYPVDIECAYAGGQLHLLQCRPITTLK